MLSDLFQLVLAEVGAALTLQPHVSGVGAGDQVLVGAVLAVLVAVSMLAGESALLAINRVRGLAYWLTLAMTATGVLLLYLTQASLLWVLGIAIGQPTDWLVLAYATLLAASPKLLSFIQIVPGFGPFLGRLLSAWGFLVLWAATASVFAVGEGLALLVAATAGLTGLAASHFGGPPLVRVRDRIWTAITGRPMRRSSAELLQLPGLLDDGVVGERR
ncbi:hypothetical protein DT076_06165 [Desertihabitans brevis]|uniref:Yip1 domain-containing protein n=1 Tax=Desertihabitans brevis TaxID=2268447 RepID=A0A367YWY2_9ACTN|nr:hypothetical protein [Desertihabitans brevis]RCK70247.1 hypothetical protein DT076_06165 [Desertihabitans brevis]